MYKKAQTKKKSRAIFLKQGACNSKYLTWEEQSRTGGCLSMHKLCLEIPNEETEDFDDHAHRVTSIRAMWLNDSLPRVFAYAFPYFDLHAMCKHVIKHAWLNNIIPKPLTLSLEKFT